MIVLGYIFLETTMVSEHLLLEEAFFILLFVTNVLHFSIVISSMVMAYGTGARYNQISINTLFVTISIILIYTICFFVGTNEAVESILALVTMSVVTLIESIYFLYIHRTNLKFVKEAIDSE